MKIHLVEYFYREKRISDDEQLWESGFWTLKKENARSLIGGSLYLHSKQANPSRFGGIIQDVRVIADGEFQDKVVFTFLADAEHKNVSTSKSRWGNEMKTDRD